MKKVTVLAVLVAMVAMAVLTATASAGSGGGIFYEGGDWFSPCAPGVDGTLEFEAKYSVEPGYTVIGTWLVDSNAGGSHSHVTKWIETVGLYTDGVDDWIVPDDGWLELTHRVYDTDGKLVTFARAFADCATGDLKVFTSDVDTGSIMPLP
jgi:hypothetical protein